MLTHLEVEDRTMPATWDNPGCDRSRDLGRTGDRYLASLGARF